MDNQQFYTNLKSIKYELIMIREGLSRLRHGSRKSSLLSELISIVNITSKGIANSPITMSASARLAM